MTTAILLGATACFWISADDHEALIAELGGPDLDTAADTSCLVEWYRDADGDGYGWPESSVTACEPPEGFAVYATDCDDTDAAVNPAAAELCNTTDDDCDGNVDESDAADATTWFADADGDGFGDDDVTTTSCAQPVDTSDLGGDCDDDDADVNPDATEVCDEVDNDCDEAVDDGDLGLAPESAATFARDADGDGYGDPEVLEMACVAPENYVLDATDCDDFVYAVNPGASETCDDVDNDCDGLIDDADDSTDPASAWSWFADDDGDGFGDVDLAVVQCEAPLGYVSDSGDCDDATYAVSPDGVEVCNGGVDDDCNGAADDEDGAVDAASLSTWYLDLDGDGFGDASTSARACEAPSGYVVDGTDCDDDERGVNPGATETCDEIDDDCDGLVDDDDDTLDLSTATTWYPDADGDSFGDSAYGTASCDAPADYVATGGDCNDDDARVTASKAQVSYVDAAGAMDDHTTTFAAATSASPTSFTFAESGGTLRICPGTWYATIDVADYVVTVQGYGGADVAVLDAAGSGSVVTVANGSVTLSGLTLTGGSATNGGGLAVTNGGSADLQDCIITGNTASYGGGVQLNVSGPSATLTACQVYGNVATYGGGMNMTAGTATFTLIDTDVTDNSASYGGGIHNSYGGGTVNIVGGSVSRNSASFGGGIAWYGGDVTIEDALIADNVASYGGGIWIYEADILATNVTISGNAASDDGGGLYMRHWTAVFTDTSVSGNTATRGGGAFVAPDNNATAAVECYGSSGLAAGFWGNTASGEGGGIYMYGAASSDNNNLLSDTCDWLGTSNNSPNDVYTIDTSGSTFVGNYGDDASFACDVVSGCTP